VKNAISLIFQNKALRVNHLLLSGYLPIEGVFLISVIIILPVSYDYNINMSKIKKMRKISHEMCVDISF